MPTVTTHVSPTEPEWLKQTADLVDLRSEDYGCDVLLTAGITVGIQRKKYPEDLTASVQDGRLARQVNLMAELDQAHIVLEGLPQWMNGVEIRQPWNGNYKAGSWGATSTSGFLNRDAVEGILHSVRARGMHVVWVEGKQGTLDYVESLRRWLAKDEHTSLDLRPPVKVGSDVLAHQVAALQVVNGLGPKVARRLVDDGWRLELVHQGGGSVPDVDGVGPKMLGKLVRYFLPVE